jgi:hypothetical protein
MNDKIDNLRKGSESHRVVQGNPMIFRIGPTDPDNKDSLIRFQPVVELAFSLPELEVRPHKTSRFSGPPGDPLGELFDSADIKVLHGG